MSGRAGSAAPRLVLRADAGSGIGSGHLMRCLALAHAWQVRGGQAVLLSHCPSEALCDRVRQENVAFVSMPTTHPNANDLALLLGALDEACSKGEQSRLWLALDGYHFDQSYQAAVRDAGYHLLVIDDTAHLPHYHADIILNQNLGAEQLTYSCDPDTQLLLGPRYVLLRPEFLPYRNWQRPIPEVACRVLITMGGSDPENVTQRVLEALAMCDLPGLEVRAVVGGANPHLAALEMVAHSLPYKIDLLYNVQDMPAQMAWADLAISAGGSTCWELAFMGLPTLLIILAENQRLAVEAVAVAGFGATLGYASQLNPGTTIDALRMLAHDPVQRAGMACQGRMVVDGLGAERITFAITP